MNHEKLQNEKKGEKLSEFLFRKRGEFQCKLKKLEKIKIANFIQREEFSEASKLIFCLHYCLNVQKNDRSVVNMKYNVA